jgi:predicted RNase H-like HicB family nuclease
MDITLRKDGEGYIAEVKWKSNLYAFWYSEQEAIDELKNVIDMTVDFYSQEISFQKKIKKQLISNKVEYAV